MTQTYCSSDDIKAIIGDAGFLASIDDDESGTASAGELLFATAAIERGAVEINSAVRNQYVLSEVTSNVWLKWANAYLAAFYLRTRRNNPAEQSIIDNVVEVRTKLTEIRWGRDQLPDQAPSFEHIPTVSNFNVELRNENNPIRVVKEESTGALPEAPATRNTANQPGNQ